MMNRLLMALAALLPAPALGQGAPPARGGASLFVLDLAGTPVGEIPTAIKQTKGIMGVVIKDGAPMLKASASSEFLITLPQGQVLPLDFTVEFEIVPKACCNPQDLSFEGTPTINQGSGSANILWDSDGYLAVIGGGGSYEAPMPEDFRTTLPGVLTSVVAVFQGSSVRLYTNGRRLYTLDRTFARGRVLRVFLGGQDDGPHAVHLAGLRIAAGAFPPAVVAANPTPPPGVARPSAPTTPRPAVPPPGQPTSPPTGQPPSPPPGQPAPPPSAPGATPAPVTPVLLNPPAGSITPQTQSSGVAPSAAGGTAPRATGPVTTTGSAPRTAARCSPGTAPGAPPLNYQVGGGRVGGAVLEWWVDAGAEYLVERSPDPGDGSRNWTRLTSTCDVPDGMTHFMRLHEDGNSYPAIVMWDVYPGLLLGAPYAYRVTVIRPDGTAGSSEATYTTSGGLFPSAPIAAVNGNTVRIAADVSYCSGYSPPIRCDPWMMEFLVTNSSSGFSHSSRQVWVNSYDPILPLNIPGGIEGTFVFTLSGVPSGTHTFKVTGLYQPDHRVNAGSVTVVVP